MVHQHGETQVCEYPACVENPKTRSLRKILRSATAVNVLMGLVEIAVGEATGSAAAGANGAHSASDVIGHAAHTATHKAEQRSAENPLSNNHRAVKKYRLLAAAAIGVGALYAGGQAVEEFSNPQTHEFNEIAFGTELAVVGINSTLYGLIRRREDGSKAQVDAERHVLTDGSMSALSAASIAASPFIAGAQGYSAVVATAASGWLAYKTATGNEHA